MMVRANAGAFRPTPPNEVQVVPLNTAIRSAAVSPPTFWNDPPANTKPLAGSTAME